MKISKNALQALNEFITGQPPETGGILGSNDNEIITTVILDRVVEASTRHCSYTPNVNFLNDCIDNWMHKNIKFMGVFHTHFMGVKTLSKADKQYIYRIMEVMPNDLTFLYFPVFVLPDRKLSCYKAKRTANLIEIICDKLEVI